jgi:hypothetical protein
LDDLDDLCVEKLGDLVYVLPLLYVPLLVYVPSFDYMLLYLF